MSKILVPVVCALAFLGLVGAGAWVSYGNEQTRTCVVEDKDRTRTDNGSDMRVYTSCGTFKVADATFRGHFSSADLYARLTPGATYDLTTQGYRVPVLSMFPNVIEAEEVRAP